MTRWGMSSVSKKHYETVAQMLLVTKHEMKESAHVWLVKCFVAMFQNDNSRFDRKRFIEACGYKFDLWEKNLYD